MTIDIAYHRLQNQSIHPASFQQPRQIVAHFGAMQAQDRSGVKWAIGLRCGTNDTAVEQAIEDKLIIRTWLLRGTLQVVAAEDIHWMLNLLGPRIISQSARRLRQLELDDQTLSRSFHILTTEINQKGPRTRSQLVAALEQEGIAAQGPRAYHILRQAALAGLICFGSTQGKEDSFLLLEEWVSAASQIEGEEALAEIAHRYFKSHGPATLDDFAWWSGLTKTNARLGLELCKPRIRSELIGGKTHWLPQKELAPRGIEPIAFLLPAFDEYYLGYTKRGAIIDASFDIKAVSSSGVFRPMLIVNGQIVGTWKRTMKSRSLLIVLNLFRPLSGDETKAINEAARLYGSYHELPVEVD